MQMLGLTQTTMPAANRFSYYPSARSSSTARHRPSPAAWSAADAVMNALFSDSHATVSSTVTVRVNKKEAASAFVNPAPGGRRARLYCRPWTPART